MHAHSRSRKPVWIDDWMFHRGHLLGTLRKSGEKVISSRITDMDMSLGWVETASGSLYYLGRQRSSRTHAKRSRSYGGRR